MWVEYYRGLEMGEYIHYHVLKINTKLWLLFIKNIINLVNKKSYLYPNCTIPDQIDFEWLISKGFSAKEVNFGRVNFLSEVLPEVDWKS